MHDAGVVHLEAGDDGKDVRQPGPLPARRGAFVAPTVSLMSRWFGTTRQLRERTTPQLIAAAVLTVVCVIGMGASLLGRSELGRVLVGLALVSIVPYRLWLKATPTE